MRSLSRLLPGPILLSLSILSASVLADENTPAPLKRLNSPQPITCYCHAGSRIPDQEALGGFGDSNNFPRKLTTAHQTLSLPEGRLTLLALPEKRAPFQNRYRGFRLLLANRTGRRVGLKALDSCLYLFCEAQAPDGQWRAIELMPRTDCGNSFHRVLLETQEYWEFVVPLYQGSLKTRLRYRLDISPSQPPIYSNIFEGSIAPGLLKAR